VLPPYVFVLADLVQGLYKGLGMHEEAAAKMKLLYPTDIGEGGGRALAADYRRPERRWDQFGTKKELLALAREHGVKLSRWEVRKRDLVDRLWEEGVLPGGIVPTPVDPPEDEVDTALTPLP